MQIVTMVPGQGEQFQSGCFPNSPFKGISPFLCPHKPFAFVISKLFWKIIFSTYTYWDINMVNPAIFVFFFSSLPKENVGEIALFTGLALFTFGENFIVIIIWLELYLSLYHCLCKLSSSGYPAMSELSCVDFLFGGHNPVWGSFLVFHF